MYILNLYTFKGRKYSLLEPWLCGAFLLNVDKYPEMELDYIPLFSELPPSHYHYLNDNYFTYRTIDSLTISTYDNLIIDLYYKQFISYAKLLCKTLEKELTINYIDDTLARYWTSSYKAFHYKWHELILIRILCTLRNRYLYNLGHDGIDYLYLEDRLKDHINLLTTFKCLPTYYLWSRVMKYFEVIHPKPLWYLKEHKHFTK